MKFRRTRHAAMTTRVLRRTAPASKRERKLLMGPSEHLTRMHAGMFGLTWISWVAVVRTGTFLGAKVACGEIPAMELAQTAAMCTNGRGQEDWQSLSDSGVHAAWPTGTTLHLDWWRRCGASSRGVYLSMFGQGHERNRKRAGCVAGARRCFQELVAARGAIDNAGAKTDLSIGLYCTLIANLKICDSCWRFFKGYLAISRGVCW